MLRDLAICTAAFALATALAAALGARNLGVAATFGQIAFMIAVTALIAVPRR